MALDTQDKTYIRSEIQSESTQMSKYIAKEIRSSEKRTNHRTDILIEKVREDIRALGELTEIKTREIVHEALDPIVQGMRSDMRIFQQEMASLRRDHELHVNNHAIHC